MDSCIALVLQGKYDAGGNLVSHGTSRRIVTLDLSDESHWGDVGWFTRAGDDTDHYGLGNEEDGWWLIKEAFELIQPEMGLHEGKYPVGYCISEDQLRELLEEYAPEK